MYMAFHISLLNSLWHLMLLACMTARLLPMSHAVLLFKWNVPVKLQDMLVVCVCVRVCEYVAAMIDPKEC